MFVKVIKRKKNGKVYKYIQIAQGYREEGKVKHKTVAYLGQLSQKEIDSLIKGLNRLREQPYSLKSLDLKHRREYLYGDIFLLSSLWEKLEIGKIIDEALSSSKVEFSVSQAALLMVANRCIAPESKLKVWEWQEKIYLEGMEKFDYHKILRALDHLERIKDRVEERMFWNHISLFSQEVDLVFYDITSSYFEGQGPSIAKKGYSSDKRSDRNQIVLALAITKEGIPIAHEVYEGSKKHSKTVIDAVEKLKRRFKIDKLIFVADRGMVSPENIAYIKELEYDCIFSLRKRRLNEVKNLIEPDLTRYERVEEDGRVRLYFREIKRGDIRYFVCHNPEVAEADLRKIEERRAKKEQRIKEILQTYKSASVILKHIAKIYDVERYFKYWIKQDKVEYELNEKSLEYERRIAGKWVIKTENSQLSALEIIEAYRNLSEIERAFRTIKSFLDLRPIYHRDEERVKGHVFICVLGYYVQKVMEKMLASYGIKIPSMRAIEKLGEIKMIESKINGHKILRSIEPSSEHKKMLSAVGISDFPELAYVS